VNPLVTTVAPARPSDVVAVATLLAEMDRFYGATEVASLDHRIRQINHALFSNAAAGRALLAWDGAQLVGFASYSFLWPAPDLTRSLFLKELYVSGEHRRKGVGKSLMQRIFNIAAEQECSRVEWTTDNTNIEAQRFYEKLGMYKYQWKIFYRVDVQSAEFDTLLVENR
jgi:ribosomal protein S18 acetylase RimI-like enzyme